MSRIPYPDMDKVPADRLQRINYPAAAPLNITRIALHLPDELWRAHFELKNACVRSTTMDPWLREVLIMRVAFLADSEYEIHHHLSISANLGFTPAQQEAIRTQNYSQLTVEERAVAQFTDETVTSLRPSDEVVAKVRELFGDAIVLEMTVLIYSYWGTAMMIGVTGVEPEEQAIKSWDPAAEEQE
jgi:4-carboxymuconolactone decarboxylase